MCVCVCVCVCVCKMKGCQRSRAIAERNYSLGVVPDEKKIRKGVCHKLKNTQTN